MSKEKNVVQKFREFFFNLNGYDQEHLWAIMTALRGEDGGSDYLKAYTTCRIRGELLGRTGEEGHQYGSYVSLSLQGAKESEFCCSRHYNFRDVKLAYQDAGAHFRGHIKKAIDALNRHRPKKSTRDLQKFLRD